MVHGTQQPELVILKVTVSYSSWHTIARIGYPESDKESAIVHGTQ